jgi:hypothetical protein
MRKTLKHCLLMTTVFSFILSQVSMAQQTATIGKVANGKGLITDQSAAAMVLKGGLSDAAGVTNLRIEWVGGEENQYYLIGNITGDAISAKAIALVNDAGVLKAVGGPGVELTCHGVECNRCDFGFRKFKFYCDCEDPNPTDKSKCNMTTKVVISVW